MAPKPVPVNGRPRLLNPAMQKGVVEAIRNGLPLTRAAGIVGVTRRTLTGWVHRGEVAQWNIEEGNDPDPNEEIYRSFFLAVQSARIEAQQRHLANIEKAASDGSWQASAWYLERTDPENYGRVTRTELVGDGGGPVKVQMDARQLLLAKLGLDGDAED